MQDLGDNGPFDYKVTAFNSGGESAWREAAVAAIGGPDITRHLQLIATALSKEPSNVLSILANGASIIEEMSDWDIAALKAQSVSTHYNSGVLPNGSHTVTVDGHVYLDAEVNYWLYGVYMRLSGRSYALAYLKVFGHASMTIEGPSGKTLWFRAGYNSSFNDAVGCAIPAVSPAPTPPRVQDIKPLHWQLGQYGIEGYDDKIHYSPAPP